MDVNDIVKGGDERISLNENGLNKYHGNPLIYKSVFNRGSCTMSNLNIDSKRAVDKMLDKLKHNDYNKLLDEQQKQFKKLIDKNPTHDFDVFYAPSGSDLCYYPIMFSRILQSEKPIFSVVTCPEELGTGSNTAIKGKYFFGTNQFEEKVVKGDNIHSDVNIAQQAFPARDDDGNILNHKSDILKIIDEKSKDHQVIANLVIGSKSGIVDNISMIPRANDNVFWVIDVCQMRTTPKLINSLIRLNCMVMLTGSKFYQSPPFCGALLVPKTISSRLNNISDEAIEPFLKIFSTSDISASHPILRSKFRKNENYGTLLRWEAAISEMKLLSFYGEDMVTMAIDRWNAFVISQLQVNSDYFELMPDQQFTNRSIISFNVKHQDGSLLSDNELRELYLKVCAKERNDFQDFKKIIIGQPVKYDNKSFIRLALGSYNVRMLIANDFNMNFDRQLINIIVKELKSLFWS
jgi:hypothetical protein